MPALLEAPQEPASDSSVFPGLKAEVQRYFREHDLPQQGNAAMYVKVAIICIGWTASYLGLLLYGPQHVWVTAIALVGLAYFTTAVELSIMHDVSHQSFSDRKWINTCWNVTLTLAGASSILWHHKHIVRHHGWTNVRGMDHDIESDGMFRLHQDEPYRAMHRWQHVYIWFLYAMLCPNWFWVTDAKQTFGNFYRLRGKQLAWLWAEFVVSKISHVLLFMVFPYMFFHRVAVVAALYLALWLPAGLFISVIFQLAHVTGDQPFPEKPAGGLGDWALHQLTTTADFAVGNRPLSWLIGGLNFQVEHHIFPRICHIHYPKVQQIVKAYCAEHDVPYVEYPGFWSAVAAHYRHLRRLSAPPAAAAGAG
ncbi:MAG: fatty acid desaturase family protein [Candidatus Xenobia bacterium]